MPEPPPLDEPVAEAWFDGDLAPEDFRALGYRVIDAIANHLRDVPDLPVFAGRTPEEVARTFDEPLPKHGQEPARILDDWDEKVLPNATHNTSPRYFGYVMGSGTPMGILAEALAASVNMNAGGWKPAPSATEVERRTLAWLAELIGFDPACGGVLVSGGTMANVTALHTALRNAAPYDTTPRGLQDEARTGRFLVYASDHEGHVSLVRAVDMLNLGREALRRVPSRGDFTMDVGALRGMIEEDRARGDLPFCVVAQVGSVNVGAIDPLDEIADVCREYGLWLHGDGACGAVGAMLPEKRLLYAGLDRADSVSLDPHKWLYVPYECGCVLFRDPVTQRRAFTMEASYLQGILPDGYHGHDFYELGPQMSRGFRALKVWMTLKHYGAEGYRALLRQNVRCAEHLDALVRADPDFEPLHAPVLNLYCFRFVPARLRDDVDAHSEYLDRLNQAITDAIRASGLAFVMTSQLRGRTVLRLSICSHRTRLEDIERVFDDLRRLGHDIDRETGTAAAAAPVVVV
ncbi:pyridoxal phosphate-dependent decarboxylase family protein [Rubrivirga marina]|uniref:Aspartate aminotransferase family protein n=1 Tax=Rubrivirga marina TaxID=1196024 RepID=A0A271J6W9_9BACT|nr:pyridoxal-dependent decarboxylase [Rubrivirga marina]PAP78794.1 aspartate aminotransferase family protein [Rubrivirga marina]